VINENYLLYKYIEFNAWLWYSTTSYQTNTAKRMLDTILSIQPKDSSTGTGETRESIVYRQATEFLDKLPPAYVPHRIKERWIL